jgi:hypothetical protein
MNPDDLTEEQLESLLNNPEVQKTLSYGEIGVFNLADAIAEVSESEEYDTFTQGVADRSGRVTQSTVQKVLNGIVEEASEYRNED